jgi:hypothetical protein
MRLSVKHNSKVSIETNKIVRNRLLIQNAHLVVKWMGSDRHSVRRQKNGGQKINGCHFSLAPLSGQNDDKSRRMLNKRVTVGF